MTRFLTQRFPILVVLVVSFTLLLNLLQPMNAFAQARHSSGKPAPGTVLYQADWSQGVAGWQSVYNNLQVNTGALDVTQPSQINYQGTFASDPSIIPPYQVKTTSDYAVEVNVSSENDVCIVLRGTEVGVNHNQGPNYIDWPIVHGYIIQVHFATSAYPENPTASTNWAGISTTEKIGDCGGSVAINSIGDPYINKATFTPLGNHPDAPFIRVEIQGSSIRVLVGGNPVVQATDTTYASGGIVGLTLSPSTSIRSYRIIAL